MNSEIKKHAVDYLREYINRPEFSAWFKMLIEKVIASNGKISDEDKNKIYQELLNKFNIKTDQIDGISQENNISDEVQNNQALQNQKLTLKKITHRKGVNALIPDQSVIFSPACTVIYGLNGTGKTGYFRIIHELAGGSKQKSILDNIYAPNKGLEVNLNYLMDGTEQNYTWQNTKNRGISPFNQIQVFDSEYLPIFLNERASSVNVEPLGLHLFQAISVIIDELKNKLGQDKLQKEGARPDLQPLIEAIHSEELKRTLQKKCLSESEQNLINSNNNFSNNDEGELDRLKKEKGSLEANNIEDRKKVLTQEKKELDDLKTYLTSLKQNIEELTEKVKLAIDDFLRKNKQKESRTKQFEALKNIPSQDTEEWQAFVDSAKKYGDKFDSSYFNKDKKCIYCHQPLSDEAIKLVQTYSQYLSDHSQQDFNNSVNKIKSLQSNIQDIKIDFSFFENLTNYLNGKNDTQQKTYKTLLEQVLHEAKNQKANLENVLKDKTEITTGYVLDLLTIDKMLDKQLNKKQDELNALAQPAEEKNKKITELAQEINKLEDKRNLSKSKAKIESYFTTCQLVEKYSVAYSNLNTKGITDLSAKAHEELLTDSIKKAFENELKALDKNIEVSLEKKSAEKGIVRTKLKICGNDVHNILSDGEKKAVALALFFAELKVQKNNAPIVFDDPVTSFDHEIADCLAKNLLNLSFNSQIIIFTHNKFFYDSLLYWGNNLKDDKNNKTHHVCKNYTDKGCNGKGCHIYTYRMDREAKDKIGKIFEAQKECCDYFIEKAENEVKKDSVSSIIAAYLKSAIEHYIDEKILLNIRLMKDRRHRENILWDKLEKIDSKKNIVTQLKQYWDQLSDRGTHITQNSQENPLTTEDLNAIINFLRNPVI